MSKESQIEDILIDLRPLIRDEDIAEARRLAVECELQAVVDYLREHIPEVDAYLSGIPLGGSEEDGGAERQLQVIKKALKERAESMVPDYEMPPPFLGNEVEEARSKQEDSGSRFRKQYGQVPMVMPVYRGRSAVDNPYYEGIEKALKPRRNPKRLSTRLKFL